MTTLVKKGEFAKLMGVVPSYVTELGKKGRLVYGPCGKLIDLEATQALLGKTADPSKQGVKDRWSEHRGDNVPPQTGSTIPEDDQQSGYDYQAARAKRETHEAKIAELKEHQLLGRLVEVEQVQRAMTDNAAALRAALERMPDRIAPVLAAESDPAKVYELLDEEIGRILDELARVAEQLPEQVAAQ